MTAPLLTQFAFLAFCASLVLAAANDLRHYLIPNRYPAAIGFAYLVYAAGHPVQQGVIGLAIGAAMLAVGAALFAGRIMGGGDVKLLAATALWAGPDLLPIFLFATALAGAVISVTWLTPLRRLMPAAPVAETVSRVGLRARLSQPIPFGVAIAAGGLCLAALLARP
jgi:prepilin peptidase CpaA